MAGKEQEKQKFGEGVRVRWRSQGGGNMVVKEGVIVAIVPANQNPKITAKIRGLDGHILKFDGGWRKEKSYLVEVLNCASTPCLYWPRVSALEVVE